MDYVPLSQHMAQKALGTPISVALSRRRREGRSTSSIHLWDPISYPTSSPHALTSPQLSAVIPICPSTVPGVTPPCAPSCYP